MADIASSVAGLLETLDLTEAGPDHFVAGNVAQDETHLFGGQVLSQALLAAGQTVSAPKTPHSMHAYFLRAGDPCEPIEYLVTRTRDGRRLSTRAVSAMQGGKPIATVLTSFADTDGTLAHQIEAPHCARPDELPTFVEAAEAWGGLGPSWVGFEAIDVKMRPHRVDRSAGGAPSAADSQDFIWLRLAEPVPDDPLLHAALLAFLSDMMLIAAAVVPHGVPIGQEDIGDVQWDGLSLDHAIWFHQPARPDEWLLYAQRSSFAAGGRALCSAETFDLSGRLISSTVQEGLIFDRARGA